MRLPIYFIAGLNTESPIFRAIENYRAKRKCSKMYLYLERSLCIKTKHELDRV